MGWPTILTDGTGLFGTAHFFFSISQDAATAATPYYLADLRSIGPSFSQSPACVTSVRPHLDSPDQFSEVCVEFDDGARRIGNRSFFPHNNILGLLADALGKRADREILWSPLSVFHSGNWDVGFSARRDAVPLMRAPMVLASGGMYLGLPAFFRDIFIKGGIVEGAEALWRYADGAFPFEKSAGEIRSVLAREDGALELCAKANGVEGKLRLPRSLANLARRMFAAQRDEDVIGRGVTVFHRDGHFAALRPA
jgi:hypothetical protein